MGDARHGPITVYIRNFKSSCDKRVLVVLLFIVNALLDTKLAAQWMS